jgi:hypothetical protein
MSARKRVNRAILPRSSLNPPPATPARWRRQRHPSLENGRSERAPKRSHSSGAWMRSTTWNCRALGIELREDTPARPATLRLTAFGTGSSIRRRLFFDASPAIRPGRCISRARRAFTRTSWECAAKPATDLRRPMWPPPPAAVHAIRAACLPMRSMRFAGSAIVCRQSSTTRRACGTHGMSGINRSCWQRASVSSTATGNSVASIAMPRMGFSNPSPQPTTALANSAMRNLRTGPPAPAAPALGAICRQ